jgi:hypothetical protein
VEAEIPRVWLRSCDVTKYGSFGDQASCGCFGLSLGGFETTLLGVSADRLPGR